MSAKDAASRPPDFHQRVEGGAADGVVHLFTQVEQIACHRFGLRTNQGDGKDGMLPNPRAGVLEPGGERRQPALHRCRLSLVAKLEQGEDRRFASTVRFANNGPFVMLLSPAGPAAAAMTSSASYFLISLMAEARLSADLSFRSATT